ncbi:hypothetical protein PUN28_018961 [Cardiocondyla obscurior]|uniref:Uncharacterized protein n=1 Tax=Cardiocondyla obscurior TaxID=286306 RepID=A0AAW2ECS1_9HYME
MNRIDVTSEIELCTAADSPRKRCPYRRRRASNRVSEQSERARARHGPARAAPVVVRERATSRHSVAHIAESAAVVTAAAPRSPTCPTLLATSMHRPPSLSLPLSLSPLSLLPPSLSLHPFLPPSPAPPLFPLPPPPSLRTHSGFRVFRAGERETRAPTRTLFPLSSLFSAYSVIPVSPTASESSHFACALRINLV